jgi:stage V sporulation protein G
MAITAKITNHVKDNNSKVRAYATICIDDSFTVHGLKVVEGPTDRFVSMPSFQTKDENGNPKYVDIFSIQSKELKEAVSSAVLGAYDISLQQKQTEDLIFA